jgi:hypothetical protein
MAESEAEMTAEAPGLMEPMMPAGGTSALEDRAFELIQVASSLGGRVPVTVRLGVGERPRDELLLLQSH